MLFTADHEEVCRELQKFIAIEITRLSMNGRRRISSLHTSCSRSSVGHAAWNGSEVKRIENKGMTDDYALSLPRRALVPAAVDAGRDGVALRPQNAAVPATGIRQGVPCAQPARHHSPDDRRRDQNDGVLRHLSLFRREIWPDPADRRRRRTGLWRV